MKSPEQVFEHQARLSEVHGTRRLSGWLIGASLALLGFGLVETLRGRESLWSVLPVPFVILSQNLHTLNEARKRQRELMSQL